MTNLEKFSVKHWLETKCICGSELKPETFQQVADFTVMWNLFEDRACEKNTNESCLKELAQRLSNKVPVEFPVEIREGLEFWKDRYLICQGFNDSFHMLCLTPTQKETVKPVLRGTETDPTQLLFAVMLIIYRFRNNLFHGRKEVYTLNDQIENLWHACRILAKLLELSESSVVHPQP